MLGEFKLFYNLTEKKKKVKVIQPLRTTSNNLNGLMILDYSKKKYSCKNFA